MKLEIIDRTTDKLENVVKAGDIIMDLSEGNTYRVNGAEEGLYFVALRDSNFWSIIPLKYNCDYNGCTIESVKNYIGFHKKIRHIKNDDYNLTLEILR